MTPRFMKTKRKPQNNVLKGSSAIKEWFERATQEFGDVERVTKQQIPKLLNLTHLTSVPYTRNRLRQQSYLVRC